MGSRGPLPGDPDLAPVVAGGALHLTPPPPADSWDDEIKEQWAALWQSGLTATLDEVDVPALMRLFEYRDQWVRTKEEWEALGCPLVSVGSRGQERMHPSLGHMSKLEADISRLETQFGLTPSARVRLSIELGQNKLTWEAANAGQARGGRELEA